MFTAAELLAEYERRQAAKRLVGLPASVLDGLHPLQRAFVADPSRRKAALCSRRAGKSWGIATWLLEGAFTDPGGLSVYVARSKGNARLIIGPAFEDLDRRYKLGLWFREVDNQLMIQCPNGHRIWLAGAKDSSEIGKFRGPKYRRVAIDEAQEYGLYLRTMVADVFQPALIDKHGELALTGTPAPVPAGLFYEATTGDGGVRWSTHSWTILDNPHIPDAKEELQQLCEAYGWDESHPTYQREWLGRWVRDDGALVAPFDALKNSFRVGELPEGVFDYCVVVDLGAGGAASTAFTVMAQHRGFPETYILSSEKKANMIPSAIAARVEHLARQLPRWPTLVVDEGGLGKGYADEMRLTYGLGVVAAEKSKKRAYLELFQGDLRAGIIKADPYTCRDLIDEMNLCQWLPDRSEIDPRFEDHAIMSAVYGARALRPNYRPEQNPPKPGTPEWYEAERIKERKAAQERVKRRLKSQGRHY